MGTTTFKGIDDISEPCPAEMVRDNLIMYIDWAFLETGAFFNIEIPTSGAYGGNKEKLRRVDDPRYDAGTVWEGQRKNWIWESGIGRTEQPIDISGLYINNTFFPLNDGYFIDYPRGRVIFDSPVPANSSVKIGHSYKWIHTCDTSKVPDITQIQDRSFRSDDSNIPVGSGHWQRLADTRLQLPVVCVNTPRRIRNEGYELGGGSYSYIDVLIDVIAEDEPSATRIGNILANQSESTLFFFDTKRMAENNDFPLNYNGSPTNTAKTYPELIATTGDGGYRYTDKIQNGKMFISKSECQGTNRINNNIFHCPVTMTIELILNNI